MGHMAGHADERGKEGEKDMRAGGGRGTRPADAQREAGTNPLSDTVQSARDAQEKAKHSRSENALQSAQDKNPVPPGAVRKP
ncbi:hypothetical protein HHL24_28035 [Paraburkholderia sp. RP-4-7]|jgi:hypothetical protein|uniref:Uncharacterized protein n=1 Tax=Paraburkholderia polaris TaxID=2728848 RepID=A0A848IKX0_9BURK|nr:hypothetical protein [Paraburkholderia polaris]NMM01773.1 hypothetical protein [Paraburkholderia polaris]